MNKIALIVPYYGKLNHSFYFWLKSVSKNEDVNFLLFTDLDVKDSPSNLIIVNVSFDEIKSKIQSFFNFKIALDTPYKLCDFRPCFGEVFSQYLIGYDFWGFTDTDMIYGDIRNFISEEVLNSYDKVLGRGHFTLIRNTTYCNSLYKEIESPSFKQVFTSRAGWAFDEYWGLSRYWDLNLHERFYQAILFDDIDSMVYPFESQMRRKEDKGKHCFIYSYENGHLYRVYEQNGTVHKDETMYVHFQKRRMDIRTDVDNFFMMVPNAFIPYIDNISWSTLRSFDVSNKIYWHKYKLLWNRIKTKWMRWSASRKSGEFGSPVLPKDGIIYYRENL